MLCLTRLSLARASDSRAFVFAVQVIENEPLNKHVELQVGDEVMYTLASRNISKLDKKYGPAVISKVCEDDRYYLSGLKRKYHLNQLEMVNISIPSSKKV